MKLKMNRKRNRKKRSKTGERKREKEREKKIFLTSGIWGYLGKTRTSEKNLKK